MQCVTWRGVCNARNWQQSSCSWKHWGHQKWYEKSFDFSRKLSATVLNSADAHKFAVLFENAMAIECVCADGERTRIENTNKIQRYAITWNIIWNVFGLFNNSTIPQIIFKWKQKHTKKKCPNIELVHGATMRIHSSNRLCFISPNKNNNWNYYILVRKQNTKNSRRMTKSQECRWLCACARGQQQYLKWKQQQQ